MLAERKSGAEELRDGGLRETDKRGYDPVLGSGGDVPSVDKRLRPRTWPDAGMTGQENLRHCGVPGLLKTQPQNIR